MSKNNSSKKIKIGVGIALGLLALSYFFKPDNKPNLKNITVSKASNISLEERKKQDEEYRKQAASGIKKKVKQAEPIRPKKAPTTNTAKKDIKQKEELALKAFKKHLLKKHQNPTNNKAPIPAPSETQASKNKAKASPSKPASEMKTPVVKKVQSSNTVANYHYSGEIKVLEKSNSENLEKNQLHIVVRQTEYFSTQIIINKRYKVDLKASDAPDFFSFAIPNEIKRPILIESCFEHLNSATRSPAASELVRIELLDMHVWPLDLRERETRRFHHESLSSLLSPLGSEFVPGKKDCKSVEHI